jgi:hypothetical protein
MKISEIKTMLAETSLPVTYYQWPEPGVPELPYLVWLLPESENFGADNKVYKRIETLQVEFYSAQRDFSNESVIEAVLDAHELFWNKESLFIGSESMNETIYTAEVYIEAEATEEENDGE